MKKIVGICLVLTLLTMACGAFGASPEESVDQSQDTTKAVEAEAVANDADDAAADSSQAEAAEADPTATPAEAVLTEADSNDVNVAQCVVDPLELEKNLAIASLSSTDWQHGGGADAKFTVVEYGDFQ